ncbi:restriction endonuclease subunit S [Lapillicoccus jejuensis]|uniref:Type I restriction enzyme S subunit n=1 Tax=Lapillicoccus jejuensis TaxID=402171 RepID=A0A542DVY8_9MICO|nr:restriction endonuclease subunit S [Lapillicoccus jejuensis]TQJ07216.1 type I restriction enzyme S subunit [Lapillicoccus jejuensis]
MTEHWETVRFGDLFLEPSKNGLMAPKRVRGAGVRLVNMREVFAYDFIADQDMELAPVPAGATVKDWLLEKGDLLFARQSLTLEGAGKCCLVTEVNTPMTFESHIIRVRLDPGIADSAFFYYFFRSPAGKAAIQSIVEQVAAAGIRASDLRNLRLRVPAVAEQRRIVDVLTLLDRLIETDRRLMGQLAAATDVVWRRATVGADTTTSFGDLATLSGERRNPGEVDPSMPYLGLEHFADNGEGLLGVGRADDSTSLKSVFVPGDTLYGKLRPYFRKTARPNFEGLCSTEVWVIRPVDGVPASFVEWVVSRKDFTAFAMAGSGGTRMPRAAWAHVARMPVHVPGAAEMASAATTADVLREQYWALWDEVVDAERTRDELLGPLMTGSLLPQEVAA